MFRWNCSAVILLLAGAACLMASLHQSGLWNPLAAATEASFFVMSTPATSRLRKLQISPHGSASEVTGTQEAETIRPPGSNLTSKGDSNKSFAQNANAGASSTQPPGSVLISDDNQAQQVRVKACSDDPDWIDRKYGSGTSKCNSGDRGGIAGNPTWCTTLGYYSVEARRACPLACGLCQKGETIAIPKTYLPVFLMHGLGTGTEVFADFTPMIERAHPGTIVHAIPLFQGKDSFSALQSQVEAISGYIRAVVTQDPATYSQGYNLVCYSQGGLICRAIIEFMDDHNVKTFVSLAGPHMGVYGVEFFRQVVKGSFWQKWTLQNVWRVAQSWILQATLSIANMWHDPFHPSWDINHFLPKYNNLANDPWGNARRKANFVRLNKAVFLAGHMQGSHWDGGIEPSRSGVFEYYKEGSTSEFVPMKEQPVYFQDTFGLKTLDEQGKLEVHNPAGVYHGDWVNRPDIVTQYILPHLQ